MNCPFSIRIVDVRPQWTVSERTGSFPPSKACSYGTVAGRMMSSDAKCRYSSAMFIGQKRSVELLARTRKWSISESESASSMRSVGALDEIGGDAAIRIKRRKFNPAD